MAATVAVFEPFWDIARWNGKESSRFVVWGKKYKRWTSSRIIVLGKGNEVNIELVLRFCLSKPLFDIDRIQCRYNNLNNGKMAFRGVCSKIIRNKSWAIYHVTRTATIKKRRELGKWNRVFQPIKTARKSGYIAHLAYMHKSKNVLHVHVASPSKIEE